MFGMGTGVAPPPLLPEWDVGCEKCEVRTGAGKSNFSQFPTSHFQLLTSQRFALLAPSKLNSGELIHRYVRS